MIKETVRLISKNVYLNDNLAWFGLVIGLVVATVFYMESTTSGWPTVAMGVFFGAVAGGFAQLLLTIVLVPVALYQSMRVQQSMSKSKSVALLTIGIVICAVVVGVMHALNHIAVISTAMQIWTSVILIFSPLIIYVEYKRRSELHTLNVGHSTSKTALQKPVVRSLP